MSNIDPTTPGDLSDPLSPEAAVDAMQQRIDDLEAQLAEAKENNAKLVSTMNERMEKERKLYRTSIALLPWGRRTTEILLQHDLLRVHMPSENKTMGAAALITVFDQAILDCKPLPEEIPTEGS